MTVVHAVLLAAGASRRLGQPKQLVLRRGEPLVRRQASSLLDVAASVTVVLGCDASAVAAALDGLPVAIAVNPAWADGMGESIACGARVAPQGALLIAACDQWRLRTRHWQALVAAFQTRPAVIHAASYAGICGIPALFPASFRDQLMVSRGDRGARDLLRLHAAVEVPLSEAACDVDEPDDLIALGETP